MNSKAIGNSPREPELVSLEAFGYKFEELLVGNAQDLKTLEDEGAIYAEFADRDEKGVFQGSFTRYRIKLTPAEIVEYVQAHIAEQQFIKEMNRRGDFAAAVLAVTEPRFRERVVSYREYGTMADVHGEPLDNRGCMASFLGDDLGGLILGRRPDRYEAVPSLGSESNKNELIIHALASVAVTARKLGNRGHGRANVDVSNEYDVQDLAEVILRAVFVDVEREEWTPQSAGSAKRIDIVIPNVSTIIECKFVRDASHARKLADELRIDFECYHEHPACRELFVYIYDPSNYILDPESFADSLNGLRQKRGHMFSVYIVIN